MKQMFTVLFIGLITMTWAQVPPSQTTEENPDLAAQVDYILENLDMSSINTDLLLNRGMKMLDLSGYTGVIGSDTLRNFDDWWLQYAAIYSGNVAADNTPNSVGILKLRAFFSFV